MELKEALEELEMINNNISLWMKKKRAVQKFIEEEKKRLNGITKPKTQAWILKTDEGFIKEYKRERTTKEIARSMKYSVRQIERFLQDKSTK